MSKASKPAENIKNSKSLFNLSHCVKLAFSKLLSLSGHSKLSKLVCHGPWGILKLSQTTIAHCLKIKNITILKNQAKPVQWPSSLPA